MKAMDSLPRNACHAHVHMHIHTAVYGVCGPMQNGNLLTYPTFVLSNKWDHVFYMPGSPIFTPLLVLTISSRPPHPLRRRRFLGHLAA